MILLIFSMIFLMLIGVRIAYALGISALLYIIIHTDISVMAVGQLITLGSDSIIMVALPFFLLAGKLMNAGGITGRLVRFAMALIGKISGGLSFVVILTNMIMGGILGKQASLIEGIQLNSVDLVIAGPSIIGNYAPKYGLIEAPFLFRDYDHLDKVLYGSIGKEIEKAVFGHVYCTQTGSSRRAGNLVELRT